VNVFSQPSRSLNAAVEKQKVQRAHACRMGPFCLHRATEVEADDEEKGVSLLRSE
jgi:hypothetical protein